MNQGFTALKPCHYTASADTPIYSVRDTITDKNRIKQLLFGGFQKCLYPLQKFDSNTERRFAIILERDAHKWFKPALGQFQIYYQQGTEQAEYQPDFVAETTDMIVMVETKSRAELNSPEVLEKADAAVQWCVHASDYAVKHGGKPWHYWLIPHDEVVENKRLQDFIQFEKSIVG